MEPQPQTKTNKIKIILIVLVALAAAGVLYISVVRPTMVLRNDSLGNNSAVAGDSLPVLVDLGADRCIPCVKMKPVLEELEREYEGRFDVVFYDVWKDPAPAEKFKIYAIPTQIFLDETGKELYRHAGYFSKEEILNKWKELGFTFR
jgi:thioredoxin 1